LPPDNYLRQEAGVDTLMVMPEISFSAGKSKIDRSVTELNEVKGYVISL
jgi:hypothetical protein